MKIKWLIFVGLLSLCAGIVFRQFDVPTWQSLLLIIFGVALKITYISIKIIRKEYKPKAEFAFLIIGLILLYLALYTSFGLQFKFYFLVPAIVLKLLFVVLFIKKSKGS